MKSTITPQMEDVDRMLIKSWVAGYVKGLADNRLLYEGYDEFHSYNDNWDINIHTNGEPNTVQVVAHPQSFAKDGYLETDMTQWVRIAHFDYNGNQKQIEETAQ